jgi:hypothetical protein
MTDEELVKRLRDKHCCESPNCNCDEAADRIEALERERDKHEALALLNLQENATHIARAEAARADAKEAEAYAEELERDLNICRMAQVVMENGIAQVEGEFARAMKHVMDYSNDSHLVAFARDTLAEIEGEKT